MFFKLYSIQIHFLSTTKSQDVFLLRLCVYLLETLSRQEFFKSGQKQPHQSLNSFVVCGPKVSRKNILKHQQIQ